jgi:hypothetical protein
MEDIVHALMDDIVSDVVQNMSSAGFEKGASIRVRYLFVKRISQALLFDDRSSLVGFSTQRSDIKLK